MTKLKTLKDFEYGKERMWIDDDYSEGYELCKIELRQEAIKWVKSLLLPFTKIEDRVIQTDVWATDTKDLIKNSQIDWIKHFFNITEEEIE